jgi:hypothetical protein
VRVDEFWRRRHIWQRRLPLLGDVLTRREVIRRYTDRHGKSPRLDPPVTFNEYILHRVIRDRDPRLKILADKVAVRAFISERVGAGYLVPMLGTWARAEDVAWHTLPDKFVLKASHGSGFFAVVSQPADRDIPRIAATADGWLQHDYFDLHYEWGYRDVPRVLIAEPLIEAPGGGLATEVQVYCFGGRVALIRILLFGRKGAPERRDAWFDATGRRVEVGAGHVPPAPYALEDDLRHRLIAISQPLAAGFSSLRVDLYVCEEGIKVGELTPYSYGGHARWLPGVDEWMGRMFTRFDLSVFPDFPSSERSL